MAPIDSAWAMIHQHLQEESRRVHGEIRNYPAPIPACDAQFNYLLEEREALSSELAKVKELMKQDADSGDARNSIDAFLDFSNYLGDSTKSEIRSLVGNEIR
jgi:transcriptional regulator GlxA family with amidase domain